MIEHLSQGSTEPPLIPGKLRLYGMRFCPYDHRVHLVSTAKNIPHDNVWINLTSKPKWFIERIPSTKVPGIVVDGQSLYESLIIAEFLDEKYPQRPLHSKDPLQKAMDRILIDNFSKVSGAYYKIHMDPSSTSADFDAVFTELGLFDKELAERNTKFFGGNEPGMVDYMIWPWIERFPSGKILFGDKFNFPQEKFKSLNTWTKAMEEDEAVKEYRLQPEVYAKFMKTYIAGKSDYNIPLSS